MNVQIRIDFFIIQLIQIIISLLMQLKIDDNCLKQFKRLKFEKVYRYIIYRIEKEQVVVESIGQKEQNWDDFLKKLPAAEYRYCVFDLEFQNGDGMKISKIFFCGWFPDAAKIKIKMLYATAKENFRGYLELNGKQVNISSHDELTYNDLIKQFSK